MIAWLLPTLAQAADITGTAKVREGDTVVIGTNRIRLGGIDAPSVDQLCLNSKGERWTCGIAARTNCIKHADNRTWTCHGQNPDRRGRLVARCDRRWRRHPEMDGAERLGALLCAILPRLRRGRKGRARRQGRHVARGVHRALGLAGPQQEATILGATKPPENTHAILQASASGPVAPSPDCTIKGNVNTAGECIYHRPTSRWYARIEMKISKGTRWFCSVEEAEAAGCRETRR